MFCRQILEANMRKISSYCFNSDVLKYLQRFAFVDKDRSLYIGFDEYILNPKGPERSLKISLIYTAKVT